MYLAGRPDIVPKQEQYAAQVLAGVVEAQLRNPDLTYEQLSGLRDYLASEWAAYQAEARRVEYDQNRSTASIEYLRGLTDSFMGQVVARLAAAAPAGGGAAVPAIGQALDNLYGDPLPDTITIREPIYGSQYPGQTTRGQPAYYAPQASAAAADPITQYLPYIIGGGLILGFLMQKPAR